ncbi:hypothetical protein ACM66B_003944 [Microbotryomycetes sp. NB124-2]
MLRSFNPKRSATYIGSTPDPPRRIKQHNGLIQGGAFKTRYGRPWEQEMIVYGFPSKLQALQFEWAWQNPHASRHLHAKQSDQARDLADDDDTGKCATSKPVAQFPKTSMSNRPQAKVQVLQYMLTVPPWRAFKLQVLLFSQDAQTWWDNARAWGPTVRTDAALRKWLKEQTNATEDPWGEDGRFLDGVRVELRPQGVDGGRLRRHGVDEDDLSKITVDDDAFFDAHWSKWQSVTLAKDVIQCEICSEPVDRHNHLSFVLCTSPGRHECHATFHLPCLARRLIEQQPGSDLLPRRGTCPSCSTELHWQDLVRGAYRRKEEDEGTRKKGPKRVRRATTTDETHHRRRRKLKTPFSPGIASMREVGDLSELESVTSESDAGADLDEQERSFARMAEADDQVLENDVDDQDGILYYEPVQPAPSLVSSRHREPSLRVTSTTRNQSSLNGFTSTKFSLRSRELKLPIEIDDEIRNSSLSEDDDLPADPMQHLSSTKARSTKQVEVLELSD